MARQHYVYREVSYVVAIQVCPVTGHLQFFPAVELDGKLMGRVKTAPHRSAPITDVRAQSLSYGAIQAWCDQQNSSLQDRGLNRLRQAA